MAASKSLTPEQRSLRARIAAHQSWANTSDPSRRTQAGRDAALAKFEAEVDPDGSLPPEERRRRALHARKAHMQRLSLRSARARQRAEESVAEAEQADAELDALGGGAA